MFTIDQVFEQCIPMLKGISIDMGTIMMCMVLFFLVIIGLDMAKGCLLSPIYGFQEKRFLYLADNYFDTAKKYDKDSVVYKQQMALGNYYIRQSMHSHLNESRSNSLYRHIRDNKGINLDVPL